METNPLLARRAIPGKERLQKALIVLCGTVIALGSAWVFTSGTPLDNPPYLILFGSVALLGLGWSAYFWFKKEESANTKEAKRSVQHRIEDDRAGRGWSGRIGYNVRQFLSGTIVFAGALIAIAGLAVLGLQVYRYLKFGAWGSISIYGTLSPHVPWLENPQSWFGLYKIVRNALEFLPLALALLLLGWVVAGFGSAIKQRIRR